MSNQTTSDDTSSGKCIEKSNEALSSQQTLSRVSVYASLKSLDASDETPSSSLIARIPKNVQDESLISFYETVSKDFHRCVPRLDGKNTSGRPLSASDISGRIRQRALTLVGGGYNAKPVAASSDTITKKEKCHMNNALSRGHNPSSILSGSHRKRKRKNLWHRVNYTNSCDDKITEDQIDKHDVRFLRRLNDEWNGYIKSVLTLDSTVDVSLLDDSLLQKQIATLEENAMIEWVGSLVQIKECSKIAECKERLVGMKGILISHSAFSWEIIPIRCKEKISKPKDERNSRSNSHTSTADGKSLGNNDWHHNAAITIPKHGSTIAVQIPIPSNSLLLDEASEEALFIGVTLRGKVK